MRRGLISWSKDELPETVLDARVAALQTAMAAAGLDAVAVYTTPARAAGVSWLAGLVPYWNQSVLVVPRSARPILVSALSNRVNDWIRRNTHVADVRNAPRIGAEAGRFVAGVSGKGRIGVVDLAHVPAAIVDDICGEGHEVADATALFARVRGVVDPADLALHTRAAEIAQKALRAVDTDETDAARLVAAIDGEARRLGAEEVYPAVAVDLARSRSLVRLEGSRLLGERYAVRASVAYKGSWVRATRTFARTPEAADTIEEAERHFSELVRPLPRTEQLKACTSWLIEGTRTTLPLEPLAGSMIDTPASLPTVGVVSVQVTFEFDGAATLVGAPALLEAGGSRALLK